MGRLFAAVVGYDRFIGEPASATTHGTVSCAAGVGQLLIAPSMKLQTKQREGSKVRRTYDQAQTPIQRLLASGAVSPKKQQELLRISQALDPLRLLHQLEHLQKALWRYAITSSSERSVPPSPLSFSVKQCTEEQVPPDSIPGTAPSLLKKERRKKYHTSGRPHDWRTRKDPFEGEWEQISSWLLANPELTGVDLLLQGEEKAARTAA